MVAKLKSTIAMNDNRISDVIILLVKMAYLIKWFLRASQASCDELFNRKPNCDKNKIPAQSRASTFVTPNTKLSAPPRIAAANVMTRRSLR